MCTHAPHAVFYGSKDIEKYKYRAEKYINLRYILNNALNIIFSKLKGKGFCMSSHTPHIRKSSAFFYMNFWVLLTLEASKVICQKAWKIIIITNSWNVNRRPFRYQQINPPKSRRCVLVEKCRSSNKSVCTNIKSANTNIYIYIYI